MSSMNSKTNIDVETKYFGGMASIRRHYLKEVKPELWKELVESGEAAAYLERFEEEYSEKFSRMENRMLEKEGILGHPAPGMDWYTWMTRCTQIHEQVREILSAEIQS